MTLRIFFARAIQPVMRKVAKSEFVRIEPGVLAGEDQDRRKATFGERAGDG